MTRVGRGSALLVALLALIVGALSYGLGVWSQLGQRAEASVLGASDFTIDPPAPLSLVSVPTVVAAFLILAVIAWVAHGLGRALWLVLFGSAAILTSQLLKQQLLVRPELLEFDAPNTFPSGHMTVFAVLAGGLLWALPRRMSGCVGVIGALLMGTAAWQLLEYGWHRPSDVLGGLALGVLAFALASALRLPNRAGARRTGARAWTGLTRVLAAMLSVAGVALSVGGVLLVLLAAQTGSDVLMLAASEISVVGASALAARALVTVTR